MLSQNSQRRLPEAVCTDGDFSNARPMDITCRLLTTEADVLPLADAWRDLQARVGWSPFTDYDLFKAWWDHLGKSGNYRLHIVTGYSENRLVAVLPLVVKRQRGVRVLEWAGGGWFDFCDALTENQAYSEPLWQKARDSAFYDIALIRDVHPQAVCQASLRNFARLKETRPSYTIKNEWESGTAWLAALPRKMRSKLPRKTNQLKQIGATTFHMYESGPLPSAIVEGLLRQKIAWSEAYEKKKIFDKDGALAMFRRFAEEAAAKGELYLCWMTCGETIIGCRMGFKRKGALYSYQASYDLGWSSYSPGTLVLMNLIQWGVDKGFAHLDFMRGAYNYKDKYANDIKHLSDYIFSRTLRGKMAETLVFLLPPIKAQLSRLAKREKPPEAQTAED